MLVPLVKEAGADVPVGIVNVVAIGPVAGAVPLLVIVTGMLLGCPAVKGVAGCPILVVKSGTPTTAVVGVIGVAGLFPVLPAGSFGADVVAVNGPGVVPTVLDAGVTGTLMTAVLLGAVLLIGPGVLQVTV